MPKETFFNLPAEKREGIVSAAVQEFSEGSYHRASINQICRRSNIPKGSFYQYFEDKLDLYVYIMTMAIDEKIRFFSAALLEMASLTLVEQIRLLFVKGVEFARKHPQYAALGEQFSKESDEGAKAAVMAEGERRSEALFLRMIENAKAKGEIRPDVSPLALSLLLKSLNSAVNRFMLDRVGDVMGDEVRNLVDSALDILFYGIDNRNGGVQ